MALGKSESEIYGSMLEKVSSAFGTGLMKEGSNEIAVSINGVDVTIRTYVRNGKLLNVDGFTGNTVKPMGNFINLR